MGRLLWLSCVAVLYMAHCASLRVPAFLFVLVFMAASFSEFRMPLIRRFSPAYRPCTTYPAFTFVLDFMAVLLS
jgi:hypothetical protein